MKYTREMLNERLIEKQQISEDDIQQIIDLHNEREDLFEWMGNLDPIQEQHRLQLSAKLLTDIEFQLQEAWKFTKGKQYHTWWYMVPHCKCPFMDNREAFGTDFAVISVDCPVHGAPTCNSE